MISDRLLKELSQFGFPLMETEENFDANKALSEVVKSNDSRLWEGFPVLLGNIAKEGKFDYKSVELLLNNQEDKAKYINLFLLSLSLYKYLHLKFWWTNNQKSHSY